MITPHENRELVFCHACHASNVTTQLSIVIARYHVLIFHVIVGDCNCRVRAGENPFSFHRENLFRINLVTLTDEGLTSRLLQRTSLWIRVRKIRTIGFLQKQN